MSFLLRVMGLADEAPATPGPMDDFWYAGDPSLAAFGAAGVRVTPETALRISAVLACVRAIAEDVAKLPLVLYERTGPDTAVPAVDHPLYAVLHDRPNFFQTDYEFREMMTFFLALRGNAYAHILPGPRGPVDQLLPWHPDRVRPRRLENGHVRYEVIMPDGRLQQFVMDEVMHLKWVSSDGLIGMSPIRLAAEQMGVSLATQRFASNFFKNGMRMSGVLQHPKTLSEEAKKNIGRSFHELYGGVQNAMKMAILEEGMEWKQTSVAPEEAQFLTTRQFEVEEIARIFRMPLHKIGHLVRSTFSNIEHQSIEYVTDTLMPWFVRWEKRIGRDLIVEPERYFAKHKVQALLRGDAVTRANFYRTAIVSGWMTRNEARALEDLNRGPDELDEFLVPLNMSNAEATGTGEPRGGDRSGGTQAPNAGRILKTGSLPAVADSKLETGNSPAPPIIADASSPSAPQCLSASAPIIADASSTSAPQCLSALAPIIADAASTSAPQCLSASAPIMADASSTSAPSASAEASADKQRLSALPVPNAREGAPDLSPLIADAAERLASAEIRGLAPRAAKASDDPARFRKWLAEFYQKHSAYIERTIVPLATAAGCTDPAEIAGELAVDICRDGIAYVGDAPVPERISGWHTSRTTEIATLITKGLSHV